MDGKQQGEQRWGGGIDTVGLVGREEEKTRIMCLPEKGEE